MKRFLLLALTHSYLTNTKVEAALSLLKDDQSN